MQHVRGVVRGVDELRVHLMVVGVVVHRPDRVADRDRNQRERGVDGAADGGERRQEALADEPDQRLPKRAQEPKEEEEAKPDEDPSNVEPVAVAGVRVPGDHLARSRVPGGRPAELEDRPDHEEDDVEDAAEGGPPLEPASSRRRGALHYSPTRLPWTRAITV